MPLYVLAFTDAALPVAAAGRRKVRTMEIDRIHVLYEQRRRLPGATEQELRSQHAIVVEAAARTAAILPVRFGTLIEKDELIELVRAHDAEIRRGLEEVRGRVQMTMRVIGARRPVPTTPAASGREYLQRRRQQSFPPLPLPARALLSALAPTIVSERREPGAGRLLATVYHLVNRTDIPRYQKTVSKMPTDSAIVSGPWPPFAFTPRLS